LFIIEAVNYFVCNNSVNCNIDDIVLLLLLHDEVQYGRPI